MASIVYSDILSLGIKQQLNMKGFTRRTLLQHDFEVHNVNENKKISYVGKKCEERFFCGRRNSYISCDCAPWWI